MDQAQQTGLPAIKTFLTSEGVSAKFNELLGKKSTGFVTSVLQLCSQNKMLANCDPVKIYQAAAMAAMLDLPLNPNLGFAYIIPYNERQTNDKGQDITVPVPQFQMGYKGFVQLAQRSGQFKTLNVTDVREGEIKFHDRLSGEIEFAWEQDLVKRETLPVIAYASYFKLINGFEKTKIMYKAELEAHGKRYSKTFGNKNGRWNQDFESMASKTVLKLNLTKFAPLSIEQCAPLQLALQADQASIKGLDEGIENAEFEYVDNDGIAEVEFDDLQMLYDFKKEALTPAEIKDAERILTNKETASYAKLQKLLQGK